MEPFEMDLIKLEYEEINNQQGLQVLELPDLST